MKIKWKISLMVFGICIILGVGLCVYSARQARSTVNSITEQEFTLLSNQAAKTVQAELDAQFSYLEGLASMELISSPDADVIEQKKFLTATAKLHGFKDMGVAAANGDTMVDDLVTIANISTRQYFIDALSGKRAVSDPLEDKAKPGVMVMQFAVPIYYNGKITGVLYGLCDGAFLANITNKITFGQSGIAYMVNSEGTMVANSDSSIVLSKQNIMQEFAADAAYASYITALKKVVTNEQGYSTYSLNGVEKCIGYSPVEGTAWHIVVESLHQEIYSGMSVLESGIITITIIAIVIFSTLGFLISIRIAQPLAKVEVEMNTMSKGDFTSVISDKLLKNKDETGSLARALKQMQEGLKTALQEVNRESSQVVDYAKKQEAFVKNLMEDVSNVSATTEEISASSEETAASTQAMESATTEAKDAVESISQRAQHGAKTADEIRERAQILQQDSYASQKTATSMYQHSMETLSKAIEQSHKVNEINQLTNAILDITSQTNLLALNASIEAARAGEAGRGFAVVATEIGKLAEDSQNSANQIKEVTDGVIGSVENLSNCAKDILKFIDEIVMGDYKKLVDTGEQYNTDAGQISDMVTELSTTTEQLYKTITGILSALDEVATATEETATGTTVIADGSSGIAGKTKEIADLAEETISSTDKLTQAISIFKLE